VIYIAFFDAYIQISLRWYFPSILIADTTTLVAGNWCPYSGTPKIAQPVYTVEISRIGYERVGPKFTYDVLSWPRVAHEVRKGKHNGIIGFTKRNAAGVISTGYEDIVRWNPNAPGYRSIGLEFRSELELRCA
jgi:hypothetical protein